MILLDPKFLTELRVGAKERTHVKLEFCYGSESIVLVFGGRRQTYPIAKVVNSGYVVGMCLTFSE